VTHLTDKCGLKTITRVNKILSLMERFSLYLHRKQVIHAPWIFLKPSAGRGNPELETPLPQEITPEEVFRFANAGIDDDMKLLALLGYFAQLRPAESFGLSKADFYTGDTAADLAKTTQRLAKLKMGSRLTIRIHTQLKSKQQLRPLKTRSSYGYVNVWDAKAARLIASLISNRPPGRLFKHARDTLFARWSENGQPLLGVSLHDLRRASGVYLGRTQDIPVQLLQEMMRHSKLHVTEKYMRRPKMVEPEAIEQNFDDVA
jgi:integrase